MDQNQNIKMAVKFYIRDYLWKEDIVGITPSARIFEFPAIDSKHIRRMFAGSTPSSDFKFHNVCFRRESRSVFRCTDLQVAVWDVNKLVWLSNLERTNES